MKKYLAFFLSLCLLAGLTAVFAPSVTAETLPDLEGYITDGLAAFYTAAYHSEDGKTWLEATGKDLGIDLSGYDVGNNYFDAEKDVFVNKATKIYFPAAAATLISSGKFTTEMVIKDTAVTGNTFGTYMNCANDNYSTFIRLSAPLYAEFKDGPNARPKVEITDKNVFKNSTITITYDLDAGECAMYQNGELLMRVAPSSAFIVEDFFFGHDDDTRSHNTEFAGFRFYTKALTAEEVAVNYSVDIGEYEPLPTGTPQLAVGKHYTVTLSDIVEENYGFDPSGNDGYGDGDQGERQRLTDGVITDNGAGYAVIGAWKAKKAEIVIDLEEVQEITGFNFDQFYDFYGVICAHSIEYLVSADGEEYTSVGTVLTEQAESKDSETGSGYNFRFMAVEPVSGRYVKVVALSELYVWGSEIEVYGVEGDAPIVPAEPSEPSEPSAEPSEAESSGGTAPTGDAGIAVFALMALLAMTGVVALKRK